MTDGIPWAIVSKLTGRILRVTYAHSAPWTTEGRYASPLVHMPEETIEQWINDSRIAKQ